MQTEKQGNRTPPPLTNHKKASALTAEAFTNPIKLQFNPKAK